MANITCIVSKTKALLSGGLTFLLGMILVYGSILMPLSNSLQDSVLQPNRSHMIQVNQPLDQHAEGIRTGLPAESQPALSQTVDSIVALPPAPVQASQRTEVRLAPYGKEDLSPRLKGFLISHFQEDDTSFWDSYISLSHQSTLQVYRI